MSAVMAAVLAVLAFLLAPPPQRVSEKCAQLADSVATTVPAAPERAVEFARRVKRECRNDFDALYASGRAINRSTRYEQVQADLLLRQVAEDLLNRAVQLQARNAAAWYEYGVALKKRGGAQVDAFRAINHALELATRYPEATPPRLLAEIHLQRARRLQNWVDGLRWLKDPSALALNTPSCMALGPFCENYVRPGSFNDALRETPYVALEFAEQHDTLVRLYREIMRLDSTLVEAAERHGRELALAEEWEELGSWARSVVPNHGPFYLGVAALAAQRLGHYREADSLFGAAVPALPDSLRRWYAQPPSGIDGGRDFWERARPLWLAPYNELRLEYWSRMTYALLVLRDREAEVAGPETPQGDALIRYGWPKMVTQVAREGTARLSQAQLQAAMRLLTCKDKAPLGNPEFCESPQGEGMGADPSGGRYLIWTYAMDRPSFIFELRPSMRVPRYEPDSRGAEHATALREATPLTFESHLAPKNLLLPLQVARFRAERPGRTIAAFYALAPTTELSAHRNDSIPAGLFLFHDVPGFPLYTERRGQVAGSGQTPLTYELDLPAGAYAYSFELLSASSGAAAAARDSLRAGSWSPESLLVSDLLIAEEVAPPPGAPPLTWRDLTIEPSRSLEVRGGGQMWVVWEVYGMSGGAAGTATYDVSVALQDTSARSLPVRLLQRLGVVRGDRASAVTLQWTAERRLAADGRALEYVAVQLPEDAKGRYRLTVTITDPATGRKAIASRGITVVAN